MFQQLPYNLFYIICYQTLVKLIIYEMIVVKREGDSERGTNDKADNLIPHCQHLFLLQYRIIYLLVEEFYPYYFVFS